ncbi:MAG: YbaB/EbfC family nucleoid-associated protein [Planctomycetota bacterium]
MSGSFGDMGNLLEQAQRMQKSLEDARTELREARIVGQAGGGAVRATVDGMGTVHGVEVSPDAAKSGDSSMLGELVLAALNDAQSRAKRDHDERMAKVTGGLNLPGLL